MIPYARDQAELQEEIRAVVGKENCQVLRFVGCPLRGAGTGPKKSWYSTPAGTYRVPPPGSVVLLLTDLGSTNGSWVNDRKVEEMALGEGDRIRVGDTILVVESFEDA